MDSVWDGSELIERSGRLLSLTQSLNLEDLDGKCHWVVVTDLYAFVQDFFWLRSHLRERKRLACVYGLDSPSAFDDQSSLFLKMRVLASQLFTHVEAAVAYCTLKSQLCLEANDFFDEIWSKLDNRMKDCTSEEETSRLLRAIFRLQDVYNVYLY